MKGELKIDEVPAEKRHRSASAEDLPLGDPRPPSLRYWREKLAESDGCIIGFDGEKVPVSLDRWASADPDRTLLAIYVQWVDPDLVGTTDPNPPKSIRNA
jgi:hypothetical protein